MGRFYFVEINVSLKDDENVAKLDDIREVIKSELLKRMQRRKDTTKIELTIALSKDEK